MTIISPAQSLRVLKSLFNDALYRGSMLLLANAVATSAIGFVFWTLAAHRYSAPTIGVFSGVISGVTLLAAIAAVGLPITMTRHIASAEDPRGLILVAVMIITTAGTVLCLGAVLFLGPHLPVSLHIQQRGKMALLVTILVVFTAIGSTIDAGLIATRSIRFLLVKNLVGSTVKLVAMLLLATFRSSGLIISFGLGLVLATTLSGAVLYHKAKGKRTGLRLLRMPWHYLSIASGNYLATVIGILPLSIVPIEVLAVRGAAETAHFSIAFLIAGFLNFIPSTMGQVLFAEIARGGVPLGKQFRKALRGVYGLLLPAIVFLFATAPFILRLFGRAYAVDATDCLRVLTLSALPAGGTYLVDSLLVARDRTVAYTFMQVANAALVLGCVGILLPRGLTAAAGGIALAQVTTLALGLLVLATGRLGRHHLKNGIAPAGKAPQHPPNDRRSFPSNHAFEQQIRDLLTVWPTMPTTLIAQSIRWDQSPRALLDLVTKLRTAYIHADQDDSSARFRIGEVAQCGLWFPPTEIPVGFGQSRSAKELPVLTMITGYSHWLSAILIPSTHAADLFAGWWKLITHLGAVPHVIRAQGECSIGWRANGRIQISRECSDFCRALRTTVVIGGPGEATTTGLIERAHIQLEDSFLRSRSFRSPQDFNTQLSHWLAMENMRPRKTPRSSPNALIVSDRNAMLPLPPKPPSTGWQMSMRVGNHPFIHFDYNEYSVPRAVTGHAVGLVADLSNVRVFCDGIAVTRHDRAWTRNQVIRDPAHGARLANSNN